LAIALFSASKSISVMVIHSVFKNKRNRMNFQMLPEKCRII